MTFIYQDFPPRDPLERAFAQILICRPKLLYGINSQFILYKKHEPSRRVIAFALLHNEKRKSKANADAETDAHEMDDVERRAVGDGNIQRNTRACHAARCIYRERLT